MIRRFIRTATSHTLPGIMVYKYNTTSKKVVLCRQPVPKQPPSEQHHLQRNILIPER